MSGREMAWKVIPEFPDYAVSDEGHVYKLDGGKPDKRVEGTQPRHVGNVGVSNCSPLVPLKIGHKRRNVPVPRLVADAFLPPQPAGTILDWKDGNRANSAANNLQWVLPHNRITPDSRRVSVQTVRDARDQHYKLPNGQMNVPMVAEYLGVSQHRVRGWKQQGIGPESWKNARGGVRYWLKDVEEFARSTEEFASRARQLP